MVSGRSNHGLSIETPLCYSVSLVSMEVVASVLWSMEWCLTLSSAPPRIAQVPQIAKAETFNVGFSPSEPVGRLGGLVPPGGQSVIKPSTRDPKPADLETSRATCRPPPTEPDPQRPGIPPQSAPTPDYILCKGECEIKAAQNQLVYKAEFAMKIEISTSCGYLVLSSPGEVDHIHNVLELEPPVLKDGYCQITSSHYKGKVNCSVRLPSEDLTAKFKLYLDNLRRAAVRQPTHALQGQLREDPPNLCTMSTSADLIDFSNQPSTVKVPVKKGDVSSMSIEDAAEQLHGLIRKIIPEITGHGLRMDDATIDDIEETAIDFWLNRGFLGSESDDMKAELLELLRLLTRIKRKAELRKGSKVKCPPGHAFTDLKELESGRAASPRILYTRSQILSLECKASPRLKELEKVNFAAKGSFKAPMKLSAKVPTSQLLTFREWAEGNPDIKKTAVQDSHVSVPIEIDSAAPSIPTSQPVAATPIAFHDAPTAPDVVTQMPTAAPFRLAREAAARDGFALASKETKLGKLVS